MRKQFSLFVVIIFCFNSLLGQWQTDPTIGNIVCSQPNKQKNLCITSDNMGGAILCWMDSRNDVNGFKTDIYAQRIDAKGNKKWSIDDVQLTFNVSNTSSPQIITDGYNGAIIFWSDLRNGNQDIFMQKVDSIGNILWTINGKGVIVKSKTQKDFSIASDNNGGAFIVWEDSTNGNWDIYAQHINKNGTPQWFNAGLPVCTRPDDQKKPQIVVLQNNEVIITWQDKRNGQDYDIYAQKLNIFGLKQWELEGIPVAVDVKSQINPKIKVDNSGNAMIVWQDNRNGDFDLYAQSLNTDGTSIWSKNGVIVCDAQENQSEINLASEAFVDGIIISWEDERNNKTNIYCQKINLNGQTAWENNGLLISNPSRVQTNQHIIGDGEGGVIVVWQDSILNNWDIYSQQISSEGLPLWAIGGVQIGSASKNQINPKSISDGLGGAIYAFEDNRNGETDLYAYKLEIQGGIIGSNQTICSGTSPSTLTEISGASGANLSYHWQHSSDGITFTDNNFSTSDSLVVTDTLGTTTFYRRFVSGTVNSVVRSAYSNVIEVYIDNKPKMPNKIVGFPRVCQTQQNVPYETKNINNATNYIWSYSGSNVTINDSTESFQTTISYSLLSTSGTLTVAGANACGVGPTSVPFNIQVYPLPGPAGSITGTSTICQNEKDVAFTVPDIANAEFYTWNYSGKGATIYGSSNSVTINFSPTATSGILTVVGNNNCNYGPVSADFPITINETPQGNFSGNSLCSGDLRNGQLLWLASTGANPYTIIYNDGDSDRTQTNVLSGKPFDTFSNPTSTTNYTLVSVTSNNCNRDTEFTLNPATIAISSQPTAIISNPVNTSICSGNSTSFMAIASNAYAYQWQVSKDNGSSFANIASEGDSPSYANFNTSRLDLSGVSLTNDGYQYQCLISASCGTDLTSSAAILTVNPLPDTPQVIIGKPVACQKETELVYVVPPIINATEYIWEYSGSGATLTAITNTVTIDLSIFANSGYLTVRGKSPFCLGEKSPEFLLTVIQSPVSAGLITGSHNVCQGQKEVAYQIPILHQHSLYDDPTFTWEYTGSGVTYSGETDPVSIDFSQNASSGILTVKRKQSCGFGQASVDFDITVHESPHPPEVISDSIINCNYFYSIPSIQNATSYIWSYSGDGVNFSDSSNVIQATFSPNATSGYLTVKGSNQYCVGPSSDTKAIGIGQCLTEIETITFSQNVKIFPNPSSGILNIEISEADFTNISIRVYDGWGKTVYYTNDINHLFDYYKSLNLSNLAKGIYYLTLTTIDGIKSFTISIH